MLETYLSRAARAHDMAQWLESHGVDAAYWRRRAAHYESKARALGVGWA